MMKVPGISPLVQCAATTAYILVCSLSIYLAYLLGLSTNVRASLALVEVVVGLWSAIAVVGVFSWATGTALFWLAVGLLVIFVRG